MKPQAELNLIVYSNPTVLKHLDMGTLAPSVGEVLVEVALFPTLSYALGMETPAEYPGVAGVLAGRSSLDSLAVQAQGLAKPIVLAPGSGISAAAMDSAIAHLRDSEGGRRITLLLHVSEWPGLSHAVSCVDRLVVAWDLADMPSDNLPELAAFVAREGLVSKPYWGGFLPYVDEARHTGVKNAEKLAPLLKAFAS